MQAESITNRLLHLLDAEALALLGPLTPVQLAAREVLQDPGLPMLDVYFPVTAVTSLMTTMESGACTEVALVGREGMIGLASVLGTVEGATSAVVQVPGVAFRVPTSVVKTARAADSSVRRVLDRYTQARFIQVAQSAACSRLHGVEARLARWLLAIHDRIDGDELLVSQEFIADMLGVHRPTVSLALRRIQEQRAILRRGRTIVIADRSRLESLACECHRLLVREFERLLSDGATGREALSTIASSALAHPESETVAALESMREIAGRLLFVSIREQQAREEAEEANRAKDQFLAMVSHELRTPLNVILGWCTMLKNKDDVSPAHGLEVIAKNARAQLTLIEDLLDTARVTSATLTVQRTRVSLPEIVQNAVEAIKPAAEEKRVALHLTMRDHVSPVCADADRLRQVLLNVLTNALKFTDAGGAVAVEVEAGPGQARVTVRDTGRGIAPADLPHVFERFRQGSTSEAGRHGLGLGLTIARAIVALHGGTITLDSPGLDQGTTCTIALPLEERQAAVAAARAPNG